VCSYASTCIHVFKSSFTLEIKRVSDAANTSPRTSASAVNAMEITEEKQSAFPKTMGTIHLHHQGKIKRRCLSDKRSAEKFPSK